MELLVKVASEVKIHHYRLPHVRHEGGAEIVVGSNGFFAAVSDYGSYAYRWTHFGEDDFRKFLLELETDYLAKKLHPDMEFDLDGSIRQARKLVLELRRRREIGGFCAHSLWDGLDYVSHEYELYEWYTHGNGGKSLPTPDDGFVRTRGYGVQAFVTKTMPRLKALIRAELDLGL